ncbi:MAG: hypothetical protein U0835_10565 [Isosphaeraceae bacterium]
MLVVSLVTVSLETARRFERLAEERELARKEADRARSAETQARVVQSELPGRPRNSARTSSGSGTATAVGSTTRR